MCQIVSRLGADVHLVVGQHEADALVLAELAAERLAPARIVAGDVVRPPRGAQPAHAVRQPRRREPHLRVAEAFAGLAEDVGCRHAHIGEPHHAVAAGKALVETVHRADDLDARACPCRRGTSSRRPSSPVAMMIAKPAPSAPVVNHLAPLIT